MRPLLILLLSSLFSITLFSVAHAAEPVLSCPPPPPCANCVFFCRQVPVNTPPNSPLPSDRPPNEKEYFAHRFLLVVENDLERWGTIRSMEAGIYKNGKRTYDISIGNIGFQFNERTKKWNLKLQMLDLNGDRIEDNAYVVTMTIDFHDGK